MRVGRGRGRGEWRSRPSDLLFNRARNGNGDESDLRKREWRRERLEEVAAPAFFSCTSMLAFGADTPFKWVERAIEFVGQPGRRRCPCSLPTAKYAARAAAMPSSSTSTTAISLPGARPSAWLNSSQPMGCFAPVAAGSAAARLPLRRSAHLRWSACSRSLLGCSVNRAHDNQHSCEHFAAIFFL